MAAPTISEREGVPPGTGGSEEPPVRYHLLALGPECAFSHELPLAGSASIGRDEGADVRVVDPMASRQHARLHVGERFEIEDLGSSNGTRLRDQRLPPGVRVPLLPGEAVTIGATLLVLQRRERPMVSRNVWPHGYFETRLIETCAQAERCKQSFALLRIHVDGQTGEARAATPSATPAERLLASAMRPGDLLASYGPNEYEALLVDTDRLQAETIVGQLLTTLSAQGGRIGAAFFPDDGTAPQALVARACARVNGEDQAAAPPEGMVLLNPAMRRLYDQAAKVAVGTINVLITGETGAGKELLAEAVHRGSRHRNGPLVCINCAALSETLLESELFGHERGAFTGAAQAKVGLLEAGSGGTVFLDEVGEMSLNLQAKLLRAIEKGEITRVGATRPLKVDVRFVAATNRDLQEEVALRRFREDLYFRLGGITLEIPPLRDRTDEIPALVRLFLDRVAGQIGRPPPTVSEAAMRLLQEYSWPGNVRELRNVVERAVLLATGGPIGPEHLPVEKMSRGSVARAAEPAAASDATRLSLRQVERQTIIDALARCAGNQTRAAEMLGISRRTLCSRLRDYDVPRPRV